MSKRLLQAQKTVKFNLVKITLIKFNLYYLQSYDFCRSHKLFTDPSRQCFLFFLTLVKPSIYHTYRPL